MKYLRVLRRSRWTVCRGTIAVMSTCYCHPGSAGGPLLGRWFRSQGRLRPNHAAGVVRRKSLPRAEEQVVERPFHRNVDKAVIHDC